MEKKKRVGGVSLVPILKGLTPKNWRKSFYYHYYESGGHGVPIHFGVTDKDHKLIRFQDKGLDAWELFDLKNDPQELTNLLKTGEAPKAEAEALLKELRHVNRTARAFTQARPQAAPTLALASLQ